MEISGLLHEITMRLDREVNSCEEAVDMTIAANNRHKEQAGKEAEFPCMMVYQGGEDRKDTMRFLSLAGIKRRVGENKDIMAKLMRFILKAKEARWYIYMDEAWTTTSDLYSEEEIEKAGGVGKLPLDDRRECVVMVGKNRGSEEAIVCVQEIIRTKDKLELGKPEKAINKFNKGRFIIDW